MKMMNRKEYLEHEALLKAKGVGVAVDPSSMRRKDSEEIDPADIVKQLRGVTEQLKKRDETVKEAMAKFTEELKANGEASAETKAALQAQAEKANEIMARMQELEQTAASLKKGPQSQARISIGQKFVDDENYKKWAETQPSSKFRLGMKTITSLTSGTGGAGDLVQEMRVPQIIRPQDRPMTIRDLLSVGRTASNVVEYVVESGFYNNAAPVAETILKPQSSLEFSLESAPVRTIAHWMQASKQILADAPMLASYIDNRLRYGLEFEEEQQLLAGDGTGQNLFGLIPQATQFNTSRVRSSDTRIDIVRRAMTQVRLAEYRADAIVLNPEDWEEIELTKTDEGAYIWANPGGLLGPTLWGLPVIDTTAVEPGEFLVGNFRMSSSIWDREDAAVEVSLEDRDNFVRNLVTMRAEERLALTVWRPEALVFGDFEDALSSGA